MSTCIQSHISSRISLHPVFLWSVINDTTLRRRLLDEESARRRDFYLTTQHSQKTNIHVPGGIRTRNLSTRAAADPCLRMRGHCDQHYSFLVFSICRSQWPHCLRRRSAAARLLRLWVRIPHWWHRCLFVVSVVRCQVEVSATGWSLVPRSPTECGASLCVI